MLAGGTADDSEGWFVAPTLGESTDPADEIFSTGYSEPTLGAHVFFEDSAFEDAMAPAESVADCALTFDPPVSWRCAHLS